MSLPSLVLRSPSALPPVGVEDTWRGTTGSIHPLIPEDDVSKDFSKGDEVTWKSHGGEAVGEVEKKITSDTEAGGRTVRASQDDPQYLVRSDKSGGEAVHKPSALEER